MIPKTQREVPSFTDNANYNVQTLIGNNNRIVEHSSSVDSPIVIGMLYSPYVYCITTVKV